MAGRRGGMGGGMDGSDSVIAEINVTPLVDVVLVLLVIFMLTAPVIYQRSIKVKLPQATTGAAAESNPLVFTLTSNGDLYWGREKMSFEMLETRLRALPDGEKNQTAAIQADEATSHGRVIQLMDTLQRTGLSKFALSVQGKSKK